MKTHCSQILLKYPISLSKISINSPINADNVYQEGVIDLVGESRLSLVC